MTQLSEWMMKYPVVARNEWEEINRRFATDLAELHQQLHVDRREWYLQWNQEEPNDDGAEIQGLNWTNGHTETWDENRRCVDSERRIPDAA